MMEENDPLLALARDTRLFAHAPYSKLRVGAALRSVAGGVYSGCNVESVAFPVGGCAERNAIAAAVRKEGPGMRIETIVFSALDGEDRDIAIPPCGACRQMISEFGGGATVVFRGPLGGLELFAIHELLPAAFSQF